MEKQTIALHLHGPLQSWAGQAVVPTRMDTQAKPSERALKGLLAAAWGVARGEALPADIEECTIRVETLKEGRLVKDFQIISNRPGEEEYLDRLGRILNRGKRGLSVLKADNQGSSSIVRRTYLGDASLLVFITGSTPEATVRLQAALEQPVWSPYLGKRAFTPTFPFLLGLVPQDSSRETARARLELYSGGSEPSEEKSSGKTPLTDISLLPGEAL